MEAFIGTVCAFGFNFAPYGWAQCLGQIIPISQNAALFSLIGTYYGGNGTSTFGLPNLQGRAAIHQGQLQGGSMYVIGEEGGVENVTILLSNMPAHSHTISMTIKANNNSNNPSVSPVGNYPASSQSGTATFNSSPSPSTFMKPANITIGTSGGSSTPINISDPSLVMNYCISLYGIFPTRN